MSPALNKHLQQFLTAFGAAELGEGDIVVGANLLAAMAFSIANIQLPGTGYINNNTGNTFTVGGNLVVSGSHSSSLICEKVTQPMGLKQSALASHILHSALEIQEAKRQDPRRALERDPFMAAVKAKQSLTNIFSSAMLGLNRPREMSALLEVDAPSGLGTLTKSSYVFISANSPKQLEQVLPHSHMKRPAVHIGVDDVDGFERYREVCADVIDGRSTASVKGTVLLTDPCLALTNVIQGERNSASLVQRMIWLVDGNAGPSPAGVEFEDPPVAIDSVCARYDLVMKQAWGERLALDISKPLLHPIDFSAPQAMWMTFLKEREADFPGLSGTARGLFLTLFYGINRLLSVSKLPDGMPRWGNPVMDLAKFLVLRMVNARSAMLTSAEDSRQQHIKMRILNKLLERPYQQRDLYRHLNLPAEVCKAALFSLVAEGQVTRDENTWSVVGSLRVDGLQPLILDV